MNIGGVYSPKSVSEAIFRWIVIKVKLINLKECIGFLYIGLCVAVLTPAFAHARGRRGATWLPGHFAPLAPPLPLTPPRSLSSAAGWIQLVTFEWQAYYNSNYGMVVEVMEEPHLLGELLQLGAAALQCLIRPGKPYLWGLLKTNISQLVR